MGAVVCCDKCEIKSEIKCENCNEATDNKKEAQLIKPNKGLRSRSTKKRRVHTIVDSGASIHCINDKSMFVSLDCTKHVNIRVADDRVIVGEGVGTCEITLKDQNGKSHVELLHNCVYSPAFATNLISTRRLWKDNRISSHFAGLNYLKCHGTTRKYYFDYEIGSGYTLHPRACVTSHTSVDPSILHSRFNHSSSRRIKKLLSRCSGLDSNIKIDHTHDHHDCPACRQGKAKRKPFPKRTHNKFTYFGERISSDICGPFPKSVDGHKYALVFIDSFSNYAKVYLLKNKSSNLVMECFHSFIDDHNQLLPQDRARYPIRWHTDNGGEFTSHKLDEFCNEFAIKRSFSVPYAPPQNAHAERMWLTLLQPVRTMLVESSVNEKFWSFAMLHACNVHNVLPSLTNPDETSPHEMAHGTPPDVSMFRVWGCIAYYLIPDHEVKSKISPRAWPAIHLGIDPERKGFIVYIPHKNRITTSYHITFQETKFMKFHDNGISNLPKIPRPISSKPRRLYKEGAPARPPTRDFDQSSDRGSSDSDDRSNEESESDNEIDPRDRRETRVGTYGKPPPRSTRNPKPNYHEIIIDDVNQQSMTININDKLGDFVTPETYKQAMESRQRERWLESMTKEITELSKSETWELVSLDCVPKGRKITKSRWCYVIKYNRDGSVDRFKSRFVACGYSQVKGVDFTNTFSATLRSTSFRMLMAMASGEKLQLDHFDVTNAFTQSKIDAEIYVAPPEGFKEYDKKGKPKVLKLKKALYGTKQASRLWQETLTKHLVGKMGFSQCPYDPCIFIKRFDDPSKVCIVGVYVDDIILASKGDLIEWFTKEFTSGFRAKHIGPLSWFLGMAIDQDTKNHSVTVHQHKYIDKLAEKFIPSSAARKIEPSMPCEPNSFQSLPCARLVQR